MKSKLALFVCYIGIICTAFFFYPKWENEGTEATIVWDVSGYYMYLPATFIYHDIKHCGFKDSILKKYQPTPDFQQAFLDSASGNYVMKYASGQACYMLPMFAFGHIWAKNSDKYPADGFSYPYQASIGIGMLLYSLLGLYFLRKILLCYYKDSTVAVLLLILLFGTNYLEYTSISQMTPHTVLFFLYTVLIYITISFYKAPGKGKALLIGFLVGSATLIRPTDIVAVLIPLCWGISGRPDFRERLLFFRKHVFTCLLALIPFIAVVSIQLFYWKFVSGKWIVYSYGDQGFDWFSPHTMDFCFGYECGWIRYCPMMLLPFAGMIPLLRSGTNRFVMLLFIFTTLYITTAWSVWNYGGTSGRAMVQYYPVLAFPFAALIEFIHDRKRKVLTAFFYIVAALFTYLNVWYIYHSHKGNVQVTDLTREYYWRMVGRWSSDDYDRHLLDTRYSYHGIPEQFTVVYENDFSQDSSANAAVVDGNRQIVISPDHRYSSPYTVNNNGTIKKWIRASADVQCMVKEWNVWVQPQFILEFYYKGKEVQKGIIRMHRYLKDDNERKNLFIDTICPPEWDQLKVIFWGSESDKSLGIDNLKVITFDP